MGNISIISEFNIPRKQSDVTSVLTDIKSYSNFSHGQAQVYG